MQTGITGAGGEKMNMNSSRLLLNGIGMAFTEQTEPATPAANTAVLYLADAGGGKQELWIKFDNGVKLSIKNNT